MQMVQKIDRLSEDRAWVLVLGTCMATAEYTGFRAIDKHSYRDGKRPNVEIRNNGHHEATPCALYV